MLLDSVNQLGLLHLASTADIELRCEIPQFIHRAILEGLVGIAGSLGGFVRRPAFLRRCLFTVLAAISSAVSSDFPRCLTLFLMCLY